MARLAFILSLVTSLLWPTWALAASCHARSASTTSACCGTRCCCSGESEDAAPCSCDADEAPSEPSDRAPATPAGSSVELDRVLDLAPVPTIDLGAPVVASRRSTVAAPSHRPESGRSVLLRACRLRH